MPFDREGLPLAIAYVPMQAWRDIYDVEVAITRATVFKELDKPFYFEEVKNRGR
ncbi:MAG: spore coat associated protein CotJA [Clostridia bacterium]|nr:spore coat associated protein CotJA [Clostridia bacterium]MBR2326991.1 spore coat associated protein CotJA [Clostridia bacterium]